jgi:hypothetical protein
MYVSFFIFYMLLIYLYLQADRARKASLVLRDAMVMKHMPRSMREQDPNERAALINPGLHVQPASTYDQPPPPPSYTAAMADSMQTDLLRSLKAGAVPLSKQATLQNIAPELRHAVTTPPRRTNTHRAAIDTDIISISSDDDGSELTVKTNVRITSGKNAFNVKSEPDVSTTVDFSYTIFDLRTLGHTRSSSAISTVSTSTGKRKPSTANADSTPGPYKRRRRDGTDREMSEFERGILNNQTMNREAFTEMKDEFKAIAQSFTSTQELINVILCHKIAGFNKA